MPQGDPAGYLPRVKRLRRKKASPGKVQYGTLPKNPGKRRRGFPPIAIGQPVRGNGPRRISKPVPQGKNPSTKRFPKYTRRSRG